MTRPRKQTVDYFPHSCNHGQTIFVIEQRYGNDGYAFWFKLLEMLGKTTGHYLDLEKITTLEFLASVTRVEPDTCIEILNLLARLEAIDRELWESKIVWSDNFVNGITDAYRNRVLETPKRPDNLRKKPGISGVSDTENPQRKGKERKLKERKEEASPQEDNGDARPALLPAFSCPFFEITQERFDELLKDYPGLTARSLDLELKKIRDYCESNPRKYTRDAKGRLKAPGSLIRNWLGRIEIKADRPEMPPPPRSPGPPQGAELRQAKPDCPDCQGQGMILNPETQRMKICQCWRETPNEQRAGQATTTAGQCPPCES